DRSTRGQAGPDPGQSAGCVQSGAGLEDPSDPGGNPRRHLLRPAQPSRARSGLHHPRRRVHGVRRQAPARASRRKPVPHSAEHHPQRGERRFGHHENALDLLRRSGAATGHQLPRTGTCRM
ncbi:MAG: hypothetical protein AVDCRST_MAG83-3026, partial [uncultured Arthrobacter sp.]